MRPSPRRRRLQGHPGSCLDRPQEADFAGPGASAWVNAALQTAALLTPSSSPVCGAMTNFCGEQPGTSLSWRCAGRLLRGSVDGLGGTLPSISLAGFPELDFRTCPGTPTGLGLPARLTAERGPVASPRLASERGPGLRGRGGTLQASRQNRGDADLSSAPSCSVIVRWA